MNESENTIDETIEQPETNDIENELVQKPPKRSGFRRWFVIASIVAIIVGGLAYIATGFIVNTKHNTERTKNLVERLVNIQAGIEDCTLKTGKCYQENQEQTKKAIQAILDGFQQQMNPHRLRNEAENICLVYVFAGTPPTRIADRPFEDTLSYYKQCVRDRSGGTEPPPLPENPYATTTTTTETGR